LESSDKDTIQEEIKLVDEVMIAPSR